MTEPYCENCLTSKSEAKNTGPYFDYFNRAPGKWFCGNKCFYSWVERQSKPTKKVSVLFKEDLKF